MTLKAGQSRRLGAVFALVGALGALGFGVLAGAPTLNASARGAAVDCGPYADAKAGQATPRQLRQALRCLINAKRTARDRRPLRTNRPLTRVARRHTAVMLEQECFGHQCKGERPLSTRIEGSGYLEPKMRYGYGENLGCSRTPRAMLKAFMRNTFHRSNILKRRFRHIGIGAKRGSPGVAGCSPEREYVTYTVIFGWRKRAS